MITVHGLEEDDTYDISLDPEHDVNVPIPEDKKCEENEKEVKEAPLLASYKKIFSCTTTTDKIMLFFAALCSAIQGTMWVIWSVLFGNLMDKFGAGGENMYEEVSGLVVVLCITGVISFITSSIGVGGAMYVAGSIVHKIRCDFMESVLRQESGWHESFHAGELSSRLEQDSSDMLKGIGEKMSTFIQSAAGFVAGFIVAFVYGWQLALILLLIIPVMGGLVALFATGMSDQTKEKQDAYAKAGSIADESLGSVTTVTAFGVEKTVWKKYVDALEISKSKGIELQHALAKGIGGMQFIIMASYGVCLFMGVIAINKTWPNALTGKPYTGGDVMVVFFAIIIGAFSLGPLGGIMQAVVAARSAAYRLFEVIERESMIDNMSTEGDKFNKDAPGDIVFKDVCFAYPTRATEPVFENLNISIPENKCVAFVGESGSGKSSIFRLLQRFYHVQSGMISIGGKNINEFNITNWRDQFGVVSQEPVLFQGTVRENIMFGRRDATDDEIVKAAKAANAHEFIIHDLEDGYNSMVGDGGSRLSGGQKQRIGIARALLRDPHFLLLDEATSALDNESEKAIQESLLEIMKNRTVIVVAHRLTTIQNADRIYMLEKGVVKETGTHDELIELDSLYANLVKIQVEAKNNHEIDEEYEKPMEKKMRRVDTRKLKKVKDDEENIDENTEKKVVPKDEYPLRRIWEVMEPADTPLFVLSCISSLISGSVQPLWAVIFGEVVKVLYEIDHQKQMDGAIFWCLLFVALGVVVGLADYYKTIGMGTYGERMARNIRSKVFEHMLFQEVGFFDFKENNSSKLANRLGKDADLIHGGTTTRLSLNIQMALMLVVGISLAFYYSWALSICVVVTLPIMGFAAGIQNQMLVGFYGDAKAGMEESARISSLCIDNIQTVLQLGSAGFLLDSYKIALEEPFKIEKTRSISSGLGFGFGNGITFIIYGFCFWCGAVLIDDTFGIEQTTGKLTFPEMMKCMFALMMAGMGIGQVSSSLPDLASAIAAKNSVFEFLDRKSLINAADNSGEKKKIIGNISVEDVEFSYPTDPENIVLQNFTLNIPANSTLALTGFSGHGKSTLISLLQRFYDYQKGEIKIDGMRIVDSNVSYLRSQIGYVKQEPVLFDTSIIENIRFGKADATEAEVKEACERANAWHFISELKDGLQTNVGAKGSQLSGGQKQRIALARALVRKPAILLLDEATSALDAESERVVQEALDEIIRQKSMTIILIAHRLNTIKDCDQIAFVEHGRVAEIGSHAELMERKGLYFDLVNH